MNIKIVKVSDKGQIAIPQEIRKNLGIGKGDEIILIQDSGKVLIEKASNLAKKLEDDFKDVKKLTELSLKEVWDNKEDDIWEEYLK
ncbi:AbrB/MazE/SpoVT family DNA-binding domain-containing protein [Candidatus Pacearchaeota archaeon]|nr:AbrB/MazE/SpoVT family DNA-binding domain-containing protein [Candidatus Pacearchaeota archaeon]